tara:strand:+ start:44 stop:262 length:219 start_codon:yes stop_codon:yes gene_type:complete
MTDKNSNNQKAVLTFEGKKYIMDELSDETKEIIKNLQIADAQLKMHEDTLKLLSLGKVNLVKELRKKLESSI